LQAHIKSTRLGVREVNYEDGIVKGNCSLRKRKTVARLLLRKSMVCRRKKSQVVDKRVAEFEHPFLRGIFVTLNHYAQPNGVAGIPQRGRVRCGLELRSSRGAGDFGNSQMPLRIAKNGNVWAAQVIAAMVTA
jgi:hypothetical protein